jgi:hypothetical protein
MTAIGVGFRRPNRPTSDPQFREKHHDGQIACFVSVGSGVDVVLRERQLDDEGAAALRLAAHTNGSALSNANEN